MTSNHPSESLLNTIQQNDIDNFELLISKKKLSSYPEFKTDEGYELLREAITQSNVQIVASLIKNKAKINNPCDLHQKTTPLELAINTNNPQMVGILLDNGAHINSKSVSSSTLGILFEKFYKARQNYFQLLSSSTSKNSEPEHLLIVESIKQEIKNITVIIELLLQHGNSIDKSYCKNGLILLFETFNESELDLIKLLLDYGADINAVNIFNKKTFIENIIELFNNYLSFYNNHEFERLALINYENIIKYLISYCVKLINLNQFVSSDILTIIDSNTKYIDYRRKCENEIIKMKKSAISQQLIDVYATFIGDMDFLVDYKYKDEINYFLNSPEFLKMYPIYGEEILKRFNQVKEKKGLLKKAKLCFDIHNSKGEDVEHIASANEMLNGNLSKTDFYNLVNIWKNYLDDEKKFCEICPLTVGSIVYLFIIIFVLVIIAKSFFITDDNDTSNVW